MFNLFGKNDERIQQDVLHELTWDPSVTAKDITVTAKDGIVTLYGSVPHYFDKNAAEKAAQRVGGVRAVADEMEVNLMGSYSRKDGDIANAAASALEWSYSIPQGVKVAVEKGWVTLSGQSDWEFERTAAHDAVSDLMGVVGVTNDITLRPRIEKANIKADIEMALKRSAESEGRKIKVAVDGTCVTLSGDLESYSEIEDARMAAWSSSGVTTVENNLHLAH